ncbi:RNA-directed DNA polymerase [Autumnicola psychrophila]|uniref:RNA-directed DNA polymerase n=1 Tax=Autumnicola psychrophila TaxID=3075592 RepID=A0ABU3DVC8_9FLAO|nr:RNA-directed DNA polymerase [Zunongwangia sp. F225]MDT0687679.1 RNA-directed DNA polymerase [Zunongwangia sp. F225]
MITDRFHQLRREELAQIFTKNYISSIWRKVVRDQLRKTDILDIYDYYDFNYNIDSRAQLLRTDILNGMYSSSKPLIYRIEKKFGICRHLIIPQPIDALVLQIITEWISKEVLSNQPSKNSFYSRDRHNLKKPYQLKEDKDDYGFDWKKNWKKMQKKIYSFNEEKELIIVTDLSNYYDSIYIPELRKIITGYIDKKESLLDILFGILERNSWLPDYLPYTGRGLPTSNLEAVRLLAHSFLFEFDSILMKKTNNNFIRWMDDVTIGVDTREEAVNTLSSASDVLKSRGLALNLKKTNIYNSKEAEFHFLIEENRFLDSFENRQELGSGSELSRRFRKHLKNNASAKYFEKVTKRYITAFGKLNSKRILKDVPKLYNETPGIRPNLLYYLSMLGYSKRTSRVVLEIFDELKLHDDISLFSICHLITDWNIPLNEDGDEFIKNAIAKIKYFSKSRKQIFDFYCLLWVKTKYDHPVELFNFIEEYKNIWKTHPFSRRQVTSIMARLFMFKEDKVQKFLESQISTAEQQVVSIANTLIEFKNSTEIERKVSMYLFPKNKYKIYPLNKFLVLCSFLNSSVYQNDDNIKEKIRHHIDDPYYKKWIELQYNIK